jgi:hypothetical protein
MDDDFNNNKIFVNHFKNPRLKKFVYRKGTVKRVNFINECDSNSINVNKRMDFMGSIRIS